MSGPNDIPTPLLLGPLPSVSVGSAQSKSEKIPYWGGYLNLSISWMSLSITPSFVNNPPWHTNTLVLIIEARGKALNI